MRATIIHGAGDVKVENVPDASLQEPTDALVRVVAACICGSDLWPYRSMPASEKGSPNRPRVHRRNRGRRCSGGGPRGRGPRRGPLRVV